MLFTIVGGAWCQNDSVRFTPEQQAIIDLSNQKWTWMAETLLIGSMNINIY